MTTTGPRNGFWLSPFAQHMGFELVEWEDGRAVAECLVKAEHANTRGIAHGGVLSALMDMACGGAVGYHPSVEGRGVVTVVLNVNYVHPAEVGDRVRAVGRRRGTGKRVIACDVEVTNQKGVTLALGLVTLRVVGQSA